ncbi:NAD(P)/FAD-dependent oxidoreductase, partial [Streptomyces sp. NPDC006356]
YRGLGFAVDLGGDEAAADPFGVPLSGLPAKTATRGYHLVSLPGNRARVATDWLLDAILPRPAVPLGLVRGPSRAPGEHGPEIPVTPRR